MSKIRPKDAKQEMNMRKTLYTKVFYNHIQFD